MSEYKYTRPDGHWVTDPVEIERLNRSYWTEVAGRILVDETWATGKRILRAWAVQVGPSEWVVQYLCHRLGKNPWVHAGKSNGPFTTPDEARAGVARLARVFEA